MSKLSYQYTSVSPNISTTLQSAAIVSRIFYPNLLESACDSVVGLLATPQSVRFEPFAKACIVENVFDYIRYLCTPSIPLTVTELCTRVVTGLPLKIRPDDKQLDEYRVHAEKRGKKQSVLPVAEKIMHNLRVVDGRVDSSTAYLFVQILEHMLSSIVQTALNYQSELGESSKSMISSLDIQHIFSLLGSTSTDFAGGEMPLVHRNTDTYEGCLRDLQAFLKNSNWSLSLVTRIFYEPLTSILTPLANDPSIANTDLGKAAASGLTVFKMAKSLVGDLNILSEVSDDIFDSTAHLLNYCLQEPAEEDLYQGYAYYAKTLFTTDVHQWISVLSECPKIFFALRRCHRRMISTIYNQVSLRHMHDLEMRFADPHTCPLCVSTVPEPITTFTIVGNTSSGGLFSHPVFRRLSSTKSPNQQQLAHTPATTTNTSSSCSSSGERSPPPGSIFIPSAPGGGPIHGGGSRTCSQMVIAWRYFLPRLLLMPVYQILYLTDLLDELCTFPNQDPQEQAILHDAASMLYKTRKAVAQELSHAIETTGWIHTHLPRLSFLHETPLSTRPAFRLPVEARVRLAEIISTAKNSINAGSSAISDVTACRLTVNDYIMFGVVQVRQNPVKTGLSDRVVYLFTDCLLLLKRSGQQRRLGGNALTNVAMAAAAALTNPTSSNSTTCGSSGLLLKKGIPLTHFHLTDLGMQIHPDTGEAAFLFELEYWRDVTVVSRSSHHLKSEHSKSPSEHSHQPHNVPFSTLSLPKQGSAVSLSAFAQTSTRRLSGSSTALNTPSTEISANNSSSVGETIANSSAPAKRIIFSLKTAEEKADWMATLIAIQRKGIFTRYLRELPKQEIPLILPDPEEYCFSQPDSSTNVLFEPPRTDSSAEIAVIRAATINKLIERVTSHTCFDSRTIRTFFQTYRRYLSATELLELLIKRFNMPRPDFDRALRASLAKENYGTEAGRSFSDIASLVPRMELRFNSTYKRRIQYRVLSFIKKWVRDTSYFKVDFADNPSLKQKLEIFLSGIDAVPSLAENVTAILRCLHGDRAKVVQVIRQCAPEKLDLGLALTFDRVRITNVHPLELARQVTLYEWDLYSRIEFNEVNGSEKNWGVNMRRSLDFSNRFLKWLIWSIMCHRALEDRVIVLQRVLDLLMLFEALGNLQGTQEARAALQTSPVHRLSETFDVLYNKSRAHHRALLEVLRPAGIHESELLASPEDYIDDYQHQVHRIDPPAVPFIAVGGQTRLIHLELKLPDYLPGGTEKEPLINFSKCHQIADLKEHYLSFQNIPFNLQPDPVIQDFLKHLDPHALAGVKDEAEFEDLMFQQSLCIQPREGTTPSLSNFPSAESSMNRQLTATELRIGNLISAAPIDVNMKTGFKEFRQLIVITSISPDAKFDFATSANSVLLPNRTPSCGSLSRGLKARDQLSASCSASSTECSSRVSPALHIELGVPPPLPPKPTGLSLHTSPLPVGEWREVFTSDSEYPDVTDSAAAVAAPPLPPRASASPSIDRNIDLSPHPMEEHYQYSRSSNPTASLERWCQLSGSVDSRPPPPPPPPPKSSATHFSPSLHSDQSDDAAPELPPRTSYLSRSQVSSPMNMADWYTPPLPPKKHPS